MNSGLNALLSHLGSHAILSNEMTTPDTSKAPPPSPRDGRGAPAELGSLAAIDLSWAKAFHTVNIVRWSEPPGPDGFECATWRVMVGAFGTYVSSNHPDLEIAIKEALERAAADPALQPLLPKVTT